MFQPPVHTSYLSGAENLSCGEICPHDRWSGGVILHMTDEHVEKILHVTDGHVEKNSLHEKCEENLLCGEIMCTMYGVLSLFTLFCCNIFL